MFLCNVSFFYAGQPLPLEEDNFAFFATQCVTPEVIMMSEADYTNKVSKAQKVIQKLHSVVRKTRSKQLTESVSKGKDAVVDLGNDDDDFMTPVPRKGKGKGVAKDVEVCSRGSSDDFVTQKPRKQATAPTILSNKRATKKAVRFREPIVKLVPYIFPHLSEAKDIKALILSPEFLIEHGE